MNERTLIEFASYYKRIIRIERILKDLLYEKYMQSHGKKRILLYTKDILKNYEYFKIQKTEHFAIFLTTIQKTKVKNLNVQ